MLFATATARDVQATIQPDVSTDEPKLRMLGLVSLTSISSPKHNTATLKVNVDGTESTFEHNGGVGPVDAICGALHEVVPNFSVLHCRTEESGPGSDATAMAHVQIGWGGLSFAGIATHPNTLDATAGAIIDALNKLRPLQSFFGGRAPLFEIDDCAQPDDRSFLAGFIIDEAGGSRGRGMREIAMFHIAFDVYGKIVITRSKTNPSSKLKRRINKAYHAEKSIDVVKTRTRDGMTCHLFVERKLHRVSRPERATKLS